MEINFCFHDGVLVQKVHQIQIVNIKIVNCLNQFHKFRILEGNPDLLLTIISLKKLNTFSRMHHLTQIHISVLCIELRIATGSIH